MWELTNINFVGSAGGFNEAMEKGSSKTKQACGMTKIPQAKSKFEEMLALHIRVEGLPPPSRELVFHPERDWRFDFAWKQYMFAVEVDGGTYATGKKRGRHTRGVGYDKDCEKYGEAIILGWNIYRCSSVMVKRGDAIDFLVRLFNQMGWNNE